MSDTGKAIRAVCRIINKSSCGSGSVCGKHPAGGSYVLTNAHVAGSRVGRIVTVEVESLGRRRFEGRVIRAAYSSRVSADWALIHVEGLEEIEPVYLTRELPRRGESMYTKGFPRCQPHDGTDIEQFQVLNNGVLLWEPDAIGGQSGSGVWGDEDHLQKALLTWSMQYKGKWRGAGQLTNEIWQQNRSFVLNRALRGAARIPGAEYVERPSDSYDFTGIDRSTLTDPSLNEGIFSERLEAGISDIPEIWFEEIDSTGDNDIEGEPDSKRVAIAALTRVQKMVENELSQLESQHTDILEPEEDSDGSLTFGL